MACFLFTMGCSRFEPIESVEDPALALKRRGIAIQSMEPIDFSSMRFARIDEGLSLQGDGVRIEILRIEDGRIFKAMAGADTLLTGLGGLFEGEAADPPETYIRRPFAVVIREEPRAGQARAILSLILPQEGPEVLS